ncbi:acyl-CoA dehydrogenase [Sorangium sp. So ce269]
MIYADRFRELHGDLRQLVHAEIFSHREGLTHDQRCQIAYDRLRFINQHIESGSELVRNPLRLFAAHEWIGLVDTTLLPLLTIHYNLCLGSILQLGGERQDLADHIGALESMSSVGVFLATELGYGNNVIALETEAVYDPTRREFVLHTPSAKAQKFMPNTGLPGIPKLGVVMARLKSGGRDHGVFPFIVRISDERGLCEGIRVTRLTEKPGFSLDNAVTSFDRVRVPRGNLLCAHLGVLSDDGTFQGHVPGKRARFLRAMDRVQAGKLCLTSALVACARASLLIAIRYAHRRETFAPGAADVPVIQYRNHQLSLFGGLARVYAMTFLLNFAKESYANSPDDASVHRLTAIVKAAATWAAADVIHQCRERCGAQGMFSVNRIADYVITGQGAITAEGDNEVIMSKAASELLASNNAPPGPGHIDPEGKDLLDEAFLMDLLAFRERELRDETTRAFHARLLAGGDGFSAWNDSINAAISVGSAHAARLAFERFAAAARDAEVPESKSALRLLLQLYALQELSRSTGWLLARSALTREQVDRLPGTIDALCAQILPHALLLVDGFNIPNSVLRAPIATDDYIAAFDFRPSAAALEAAGAGSPDKALGIQ